MSRNSIKMQIIGTPIKIQKGNLVFINRHFRQVIKLDYEDAAKLYINPDSLLVCNGHVKPTKKFETLKLINIYDGRVILPSEWLQQHQLQPKNYIFQFLTSEGVLILPKQQKCIF